MYRYWFLCLLSTIAFSACDLRYITTNTYNRYAAEAPFDVVIVPGTPYDSTGPSGLFKVRMYWAKQLYDQGIARNIIFSGAAVHTPYIESVAMKLYANALGIPPSRTFVEIRATHSNENVFYGLKMAHQLGFKKIALATDPIQSLLYGVFRKVYAPDLAFLPVSVDSMRKFATELPDICINAHLAYVDDFTPPEKRNNSLRAFRKSFGKLTKE